MVRDSELAKVPYCLVVGDKEVDANGVTPRQHGGKQGEIVKLDEFVAQLQRDAAIPY